MTTYAPVEVHPPVIPDFMPYEDLEDDEDKCTEGMDIDDCDRLCTKLAKSQGICRCKRRKE